MSSDRIYFKNLNAIRFIAAMMVFLQHAVSPSYGFLGIEGTFTERFLATVSNGGLGVSIFFVLSGFLITYLLVSEHELKGTISVKSFYIRRVLRIWPLFFVVVIFSCVVYPVIKQFLGVGSPGNINLLYHFTFLSNFDILQSGELVRETNAMSQNITWSVSIEEQFYVFWPLLFVFSPKKWWGWLMFLVIAGSMTFRFMNHGNTDIMYFHTLSVLVDLATGGLMAYLVKTRAGIRKFFENSDTRTHLLLLGGTFCLLLWEGSWFGFPYGHALSRIFTAVAFAMIIAAQALTKSDSRLNLGNWRFASRWGIYTYGIYMLHPVAIFMLDLVFKGAGVERNSFLTAFSFGLVCLVMTLLLSRLSYYLLESPFLRLKDRFAVIRTTAAQEPSEEPVLVPDPVIYADRKSTNGELNS